MIRAYRSIGVLATALLLVACDGDDPVAVGAGGGEQDYVVVLNSTALTLTLVAADGESAERTIELGAQGTPASMAVRGETAVVPLGLYPAVAIADLENGTVSTVALPDGSGATGAIILNDSIALVANSALNTVTPVLYDRAQALPEIDVGLYPQGFVASGDHVFVLNGRLENFVPVGPANLTVIDASTLAVLDSIQLSGTNPGEAIATAGSLFVLNQGSWGAGDGSVSEVSLTTMSEIAHHTGFGDLPGALARSADGTLLVGSFGFGIAAWSPASGEFLIEPAEGVRPTESAVVSDVGVDADGRIYALDAGDCTAPGALHVLDEELRSTNEVETGACPLILGFTRF